MIDEATLQAESAEIERLLAELRAQVDTAAWGRIDQVLRRVLRLHGVGLGRALEHGRRAGADAGQLDALVVQDELLASLLVLHGLHPRATEDRVREALARVRAELGVDDDTLVLVGIDEGVVHLHARAALGGGAMSSRVAEGVITRVIEAAAPEIASLRIEGLPVPRDPSLVQLRTPSKTP